MSHDDQLRDPFYRNWVKAGLGIKYLHEGVVNYIDRQVKTLQNDFLTDIRNTLSDPSATCSNCKIENVLPCPTAGICVVRRGMPCRFHVVHTYTPCPNKVCDIIHEKIKANHRYGKPSWKNTDPTKWCTNHWEIGKCFMAETGYYDKQSAVDTDCPGLLSVIVNCLFMVTKFDVYIDPPNDIVCKNRQARNEIFHSASMKFKDAERDSYLDDMVSFLKDKKLTGDFNAQSAITKLDQLKVKTLAISIKEEYEIRLEALYLVETLKQEAISAIREKKEECTKAVASDAQKALETIEETKDEAKKAHDAHTKDTNEIFTRLTEHGERIEQSLDAKVASIKQVLDMCQGDANAILKDIQELKEHHSKKVDDLQMYMQNKRDLQTKLYTMYAKHLSSVPLSPLLDDIDAHINDIFVELVLCNDAVHEPKKRRENISDLSEPERKRAKLDDTQTGHIGVGMSSFSGKKMIVDSYEDILFKDGENCENVYIVGDAGMGKTTWCMKMLNTWVKVMTCKLSEEKKSENLATYDKTISRFDCVFFVSLRHATNDRDLLQMINHQLLTEYPDLLCIAKQVLKTEPHLCLVIVDGLDEWIPPEDNVSLSALRSFDLPTRLCLHGCTVVTTTRPWKLERLRLKDHEINRAVKIQGINDKKLLVNKIIYCLNQKQETENDDERANCNTGTKDSKAFIKLAKIVHLSSSMDIPLVLVFLVCLWYDKGSLESSMVGNFSALIDFLLQISLGNSAYNKKSKLLDVKNLNDYISECESTNPLLHSCLCNKAYCRRFHLLLSKLATLAFTSLFRQSKESTLVFTHDSLEKEFNEIEIDIAVKVGILSQSKVIGNTLSRSSSLSFLHKTIQEFLSAIHIVRSGIDCLETTYKTYCSNIDTVYEMENVLFFVSGMSFEISFEMSRHVAMIINASSDETMNVSSRMTLWLFKCLNELQEITPPPPCFLYTERVIVLKHDDYYKQHLVNLLKYNGSHLTHVHVELPNYSKTEDAKERINMEQIYKSLQDTNNLVMLVLDNVSITDMGMTHLVNVLQSKSTCRMRYLKLHNIVKRTTSTQDHIIIDMQYLAEMDMFSLVSLTAWTFRLTNAILNNVEIEYCNDCKVYIGSSDNINCNMLERCVINVNDSLISSCFAGKTKQLRRVDCYLISMCDINIVNTHSSLEYYDKENKECNVSIASNVLALEVSQWEYSTLDIKMRGDSSEVTDKLESMTCFDISYCTIHLDTNVEKLQGFTNVSFDDIFATSVIISCGILFNFDLHDARHTKVLLKTPVKMFPLFVSVNECYGGSLDIQNNTRNNQNVSVSCTEIKCEDIFLFDMILGNKDNNSEQNATRQDFKNEIINTTNEPKNHRSNEDQSIIHSIEPCFKSSNENVLVERENVCNEYTKNDADHAEVFDIGELTWSDASCCSLQVNVKANISHLTLKDIIAGHVDFFNSRVSKITIDEISENSLLLLESKCDLNNLCYLSISRSDLRNVYSRLEYILDELSEELTPFQKLRKDEIFASEFHHGVFNDLLQCLQEDEILTDSPLEFSDGKKYILEICSFLSRLLSGICKIPFLQNLSSCTGLKHLGFHFQTTTKQTLQLLEQNLNHLTWLEELELIGSPNTPIIRIQFEKFENLHFLMTNCLEDHHTSMSLTSLGQLEHFDCVIHSENSSYCIREALRSFKKLHTLLINVSFDHKLEDEAVLLPSPELQYSSEDHEAPALVVASTVDNAEWFSNNHSLCSLSLAGIDIPLAMIKSLKHISSLKNLTCSDTNENIRNTLYSSISELLQLKDLIIDFIPFLPLPKFPHLQKLEISDAVILYPEFQAFIHEWRLHIIDFKVKISNSRVDCKTDILINKLYGDSYISPECECDDERCHRIDCVEIDETFLKKRWLRFDTSITQFDIDKLHSHCQYMIQHPYNFTPEVFNYAPPLSHGLYNSLFF